MVNIFSFTEIKLGLYNLFNFILSKPIIILLFICIIFLLLVALKDGKGPKSFQKKLLFSFILLVSLLLIFEAILSSGGYFYFYVYSNIGSHKIENDAFRILFLGESTTAGWSMENSWYQKENSYPAQVEEILQQKYPEKKIRGYNKGIGGIETTGILRNLDKNMIKYKPHLVVLMAGANGGFNYDKKLSKSFSINPLSSKSKIYRFIALMKSEVFVKNAIEGDGDFNYYVFPGYKLPTEDINPLLILKV